jgi:hypothetical protein
MSSSTVQVSLERALSPLDRLRATLFAWTLRYQPLRALSVKRERRLCATLMVRALLAFGLAVYAPVLLFIVGPLALGVPHVAADLRYLVVRQDLRSWWRFSLGAASGLLILLSVLAHLRVIQNTGVAEFAIVFGWGVLGIVAGFQKSGAWLRASGGCAALLVMAYSAYRFPVGFRLVLLHGHNLLALLVWPLVFGVRSRAVLVTLAFVVLAAGVLASGALFSTTLAHAEWGLFHVHPLQVADWLSPGLRADHALGLTSAFAFMQVAHYAVWLSVVPQSQIRGEATLTFRMSFRALLTDFGLPSVVAIFGCWSLVIAFAWADPVLTSLTYVSLAMFHAYLELVSLLYLFIVGTGGLAQQARRA